MVVVGAVVVVVAGARVVVVVVGTAVVVVTGTMITGACVVVVVVGAFVVDVDGEASGEAGGLSGLSGAIGSLEFPPPQPWRPIKSKAPTTHFFMIVFRLLSTTGLRVEFNHQNVQGVLRVRLARA